MYNEQGQMNLYMYAVEGHFTEDGLTQELWLLKLKFGNVAPLYCDL